ncbi:uncharacterized protein DUF2242 [Corticibacter populi]|nr:uncharacterized protein DUF2242 [Corticibacter populi]
MMEPVSKEAVRSSNAPRRPHPNQKPPDDLPPSTRINQGARQAPGPAHVKFVVHTMRSLRLALYPMVAASALLAGGCATQPGEPGSFNVAETAFADSSTFSRSYESGPEAACEAARRALLSQAYLITAATPTTVAARKHFQQTRDHHYEVEFNVTCVSNPDQTSSVFVSAVQQLYALRKTNSSASLGVSVLGSLSVPIKSEDDSLIKVGSVTLTKPSLYKRFFSLLESYLADSPASAAVPPGPPLTEALNPGEPEVPLVAP